MNSSIDFSTATADVLASQLDTITFTGLTQGEALKLTTTICDGDSSTAIDSWITTYNADENGTISIHNLASLWRSYILYLRRRDDANATQPPALAGGIRVVFAYEMSDSTTASCARRIWYTRQDTGSTTVALLNSLAPFVSRKKRTFIDASERFFIAGPSSRTVKAVATYVSSGTQSSSTYTLTVASSNNFMRSVDVSPSTIQSLLPSGASLYEYAIQVYNGQTLADTCRYIVEKAHYAKRVEMAWLNRWGVYETLWLVGGEKLTIERSAQYAYAGGNYTALDVTVDETLQQSTGYGSRTMVHQVRDLAESPDVWLYDHASAQWKRITVTDTDIQLPTPSNQAYACTVNYRIAKQY